MDLNYTFPRQPPPAPRPQQQAQQQQTAKNRDSSTNLRASVLDAALELGLGAHGGIADWMFNNPLNEDDEEPKSPISPSLTTSEESYTIYQTPPVQPSFQNLGGAFREQPNQAPPPPMMSAFVGMGIGAMLPGIGVGIANNNAHKPVALPTSAPPTKNKLRKKQNKDGYESDSYASESSSKRKLKDKERDKEEKARLKQEKKELRKKKSSTNVAVGGDKDSGYATGYETADSVVRRSTSGGKSASKSKSKNRTSAGDGGPGYEMDDAGGKKKSRFQFRLKSSRSQSDLTAAESPSSDAAHSSSHNDSERFVIPPVPAMPAMNLQLPIAQRFASSAPVTTTVFSSPIASSSMLSVDSSASTVIPGGGGSSMYDGDSTFDSVYASSVYSPSVSGSTTPIPSPLSSRQVFASPPSPLARPHRPTPLSLTIPAPDHNTISSQSSGLANATPSPSASYATQTENHYVVPSSAYIVPSPHASPLPSPHPNVLSHYNHDHIPPPSPPPTGPLPLPPPNAFGSSSPSNGPPSPGWLNRSIRPSGLGSASRRPSFTPSFTPPTAKTTTSSDSGHSKSNSSLSPLPVQRGRSSPFPARPVVRIAPTLVRADTAVVNRGGLETLESRVKIPRYRELYALPLPASTSTSAATSPAASDVSFARERLRAEYVHTPEPTRPIAREPKREQPIIDKHRESVVPGITVVEPSEMDTDDRYRDTVYSEYDDNDDESRVASVYSSALGHAEQEDTELAYGGEYTEDDEDEDLRQVLDRYDYSPPVISPLSAPRAPSPLASPKRSATVPSSFPHTESLTTSKSSRRKSSASRFSLSPSQYSRTSVLDPEASRATRGRFVQNVQDLSDSGSDYDDDSEVEEVPAVAATTPSDVFENVKVGRRHTRVSVIPPVPKMPAGLGAMGVGRGVGRGAPVPF